MHKKIKILITSFAILIGGCSTSRHDYESKTTSFPNDACKMLKENNDWKDAVIDSYEKWGTPISVQLAFVRQESSFRHNARPIRKNKKYETGVNYSSTAYGYSQAINGTWADYKNRTKQYHRMRESFRDAVDFIGWYNYNSRSILQLSSTDAYSLYLSYHEGWSGFKNKTYDKKGFLKKAGWKVNKWSHKYSEQLNECKLKRS